MKKVLLLFCLLSISFFSFDRQILLSPNGQHFAASSGTKLELFNTITGEKILENNDHEKKITTLAFSHNSELVGFGSYRDKHISIVNIKSGEVVFTSKGLYQGIADIKDLDRILLLRKVSTGKNKSTTYLGVMSADEQQYTELVSSNWKLKGKLVGENLHFYSGTAREGELGIMNIESKEVIKEREFDVPFVWDYYLEYCKVIGRKSPVKTGTYTTGVESINAEESTKKKMPVPASKKDIIWGGTGFINKDTLYRIKKKGGLFFVNKEFEIIDRKGVENLPAGGIIGRYEDSLIFYSTKKSTLSSLNLNTAEIRTLKVKLEDESKNPERGPVTPVKVNTRYFVMMLVKDKVVYSTAPICCQRALEVPLYYDKNWVEQNKFRLITGDSAGDVLKQFRDLCLSQYPTSKGYKYSEGGLTGVKYKCKYGC